MPPGVVDSLEVIDVTHHHRELVGVAPRSAKLFTKSMQGEAPHIEASQPIRDRRLVEPRSGDRHGRLVCQSAKDFLVFRAKVIIANPICDVDHSDGLFINAQRYAQYGLGVGVLGIREAPLILRIVDPKHLTGLKNPTSNPLPPLEAAALNLPVIDFSLDLLVGKTKDHSHDKLLISLIEQHQGTLFSVHSGDSALKNETQQSGQVGDRSKSTGDIKQKRELMERAI